MPDKEGRRTGRVEGKVAFITGGGRGQGRSHALALGREGASVVLTDIAEPVPEVAPYETSGQSDLEETVRLVEETGARCIGIKADARDGAQMKAAADRAVAEFGGIDILVVNHAVVINKPWDQTSEEEWNTVLATNLTGPWLTVQAVVPHLIERGGGSVTFTASTAAVRPYAALAAYSSSKAGLLGLTRALAAELSPHWVRVNVLLPTNTATPMLLNQAVIDMYTGTTGKTAEDMEFPAQATQQLPVPWVQPEDLTNALLFLVSEEARYITGIELPVDAGTLAQPPGVPPMAAVRIGELEADLAAAKGAVA